MTRHRLPEERIAEILDVAAAVIDAVGYQRLTMEAVAARTELSKGGVYRFYPNKREVALALFRKVYLGILEFDVEEAIGWGLPARETLFRLLFGRFGSARDRRDRRVWVQLVPETLRDAGFRRERRRLQQLARDRFRALIQGLLARDGLRLGGELEARLEVALAMGVALMEGLTLQDEGAGARAEQSLLLGRFLDVMMAYALERSTVEVLDEKPAARAARGR